MSELEEQYRQKIEALRAKGLKEIRYTTAAMLGLGPPGTIDEFILEDQAIDRAFSEGKYTPIPEDL
jgi:hypothetical protein